MTDQNKKTLRSFQCRDYLWEIFGQMSAELECSVDYLINEAMRQYARSRNYGTRSPSTPGMPRPGGAPAPQGPPGPPPGAPPPGGPPPAGPGIPSIGGGPSRPPIPSAPPPPPPRPGGPPPAGPPQYGGYQGQPQPGYAPPQPGGYPPAQSYPPAPGRPPAGPPTGGPSSYPPPGRPSAPPPLPGQGAPAAPPGYGAAPQRPSLYVIFNGQKIPVAKDEFVIGRGSKTADLPIKDGNISRRHAAVVFQGGAYYIKDLGSTNGIEYGGRRIDSKRIDEGDLIQICDYELRFTYR